MGDNVALSPIQTLDLGFRTSDGRLGHRLDNILGPESMEQILNS